MAKKLNLDCMSLSSGKKIENVVLEEAIFSLPENLSLVHQVLISYLANARSGTRAQLNRGRVNHTTKKPFRQKGTGRARAGMTSSPIWRGGGRAFPNLPDENFTQKINKKMFKVGMATILSFLNENGRITLIDELKCSEPKTKTFLKTIEPLLLDGRVLFVFEDLEENVYLASRNLPHCKIILSTELNPVDLIKFDHVVLTKNSLERIQNSLQFSKEKKVA